MAKTTVGLRALARELGVTHQAVGKAIKSGRLQASIKRTGRRVDIDVDVARAEWAANTDQRKQREQTRRKSYTGPGPLYDPAGSRAAEAAAATRADPGGPTLTSARVLRETYLARMARLEFQEREGTLVDAEAVRRERFESGQEVKTAMLALINQLAPTLAGMREASEVDIRQMLEERFTQALESLAVGHLSTAAP